MTSPPGEGGGGHQKVTQGDMGGGRGLSKSDVTSKCLKKRMNSIIFNFDNIKIKLSDIFMATKQQKNFSKGAGGHQKVTSLLRGVIEK